MSVNDEKNLIYLGGGYNIGYLSVAPLPVGLDIEKFIVWSVYLGAFIGASKITFLVMEAKIIECVNGTTEAKRKSKEKSLE